MKLLQKRYGNPVNLICFITSHAIVSKRTIAQWAAVFSRNKKTAMDVEIF